MDRQLGKLFDHIQKSPTLRNNTLIVVCSDNGPEPVLEVPVPFGEPRRDCMKVGFDLRWWYGGLSHSQAKRGTHNDRSVIVAMDLVPSLLSVAGVSADGDVKFDGENVASTLIGKSDASRVAPIYWRRPPDRKNSPPALSEPQPDLAVRDGRWKLLCDYDGSNAELYDLIQDQTESTNLASKQTEWVQRLTKAVKDWNQSMPQDRGIELGAEVIEAAKKAKPKAKEKR